MQSTATMAENKAFEPDEGVTGKSPPIESLVDRVGIEILLSSWLIARASLITAPWCSVWCYLIRRHAIRVVVAYICILFAVNGQPSVIRH